MVRLRLRRVGAKKQPSYRVVAADKESPRDGRFLEVLGFYNPRTEPSTINFTEDRVYHWLSVGAQPSDAVRRLFDQVGLWDRYQRFKDGEDLAKLVEEAAVAEEARGFDPRTRRDDMIGQAKKAAKPAKESEASEAAVADVEETEAEETVDEPVAEVEAQEASEEVEESAEEEAEEAEEAPEAEDEEPSEEEPAEEEPAEEDSDVEDPDAEAEKE